MVIHMWMCVFLGFPFQLHNKCVQSISRNVSVWSGCNCAHLTSPINFKWSSVCFCSGLRNSLGMFVSLTAVFKLYKHSGVSKRAAVILLSPAVHICGPQALLVSSSDTFPTRVGNTAHGIHSSIVCGMSHVVSFSHNNGWSEESAVATSPLIHELYELLMDISQDRNSVHTRVCCVDYSELWPRLVCKELAHRLSHLVNEAYGMISVQKTSIAITIYHTWF